MKPYYEIEVAGKRIQSNNALFDGCLKIFEGTIQMQVGIGSVQNPFEQTAPGPWFNARSFTSVQMGGNVLHTWTSSISPDIQEPKIIRGVRLYSVYIQDEGDETYYGLELLSETILSDPIEIFPGEDIGLKYRLPVNLVSDNPDILNIATSGTTSGRYYRFSEIIDIPEDGEVFSNIPEDYWALGITPIFAGEIIDNFYQQFDTGGSSTVIVDTGYGCVLFRPSHSAYVSYNIHIGRAL